MKGCNSCIYYRSCHAIDCSPECYTPKKSTDMEEKIRYRKELAKFRKKIAKRGY